MPTTDEPPLLASALAARRRPPPAALPNTAVVLALGLDQYLRLVYSQLAGPGGVSRADVRRLCSLLDGAGDPAPDDRSSTDVDADEALFPVAAHDGEPAALEFAEFRQVVCAHFGAPAPSTATLASRGRLVDVEVTVERRADAIDEIEAALSAAATPAGGGVKRRRWTAVSHRGAAPPRSPTPCRRLSPFGRPGSHRSGDPRSPSSSRQEADTGSLLLLERELQALREVVEDLRRSLAATDARNIGLEVRARRRRTVPAGGVARAGNASSGAVTTSLCCGADTSIGANGSLYSSRREVKTDDGSAGVEATKNNSPGISEFSNRSKFSEKTAEQQHNEAVASRLERSEPAGRSASTAGTSVNSAEDPENPSGEYQADIFSDKSKRTSAVVRESVLPAMGVSAADTSDLSASAGPGSSGDSADSLSGVNSLGGVNAAAAPGTDASPNDTSAGESADAIEAATNHSLSEAQRNFDALIHELRAISEPRAPYHPELSLEDELEQTYDALQHTQTDLERSRAAIQGARGHLRGKDREVRQARQDLIAAEAAAARAQDEVKRLRSELQASRYQHEMTVLAHDRTSHQLGWSRAQLAEGAAALEQSHAALHQLQQHRRKLVTELKQTRHLLVAAVCRVRDLEATSAQVPRLHARVNQLELLLKRREAGELEVWFALVGRSSSQTRPLSHVDSGLYSTSESDHEDAQTLPNATVTCSAGPTETQPPPETGETPSGTDGPTAHRPGRPASPADSDVTQDDVTGLPPASPRPPATPPLPAPASPPCPAEPATEEEQDALIRLEQQVHWLRRQFLEAEQEWEQERQQLSDELAQRQGDCQLMASDIQHLEQEQEPLLLLQERAVSVVDALQNLRHVNISPRALGRLVSDALERCQDASGHQRAFRFLNALHRAAAGYERLSTESLIQLALEGLSRGDDPPAS